MKAVSCPTCKKPVPWTKESKWKPFCSERCRLIDLGEWIDEKHRIADSEDKQEFLSPEADDSYPENIM